MRHWSGALPAMSKTARAQHRFFVFCVAPSLTVLPPIVVAIIWKVIYTPDISPMHGIFRTLGWNVPALITDPNWALTSIIIADTWEWFPFTMLMVLAALQMLPQELLDAAKVDGCSPWQLTWHVTLPFILFFSSRRRHTRLQGDWSSDVCSSDLRLFRGRFCRHWSTSVSRAACSSS